MSPSLTFNKGHILLSPLMWAPLGTAAGFCGEPGEWAQIIGPPFCKVWATLCQLHFVTPIVWSGPFQYFLMCVAQPLES